MVANNVSFKFNRINPPNEKISAYSDLYLFNFFLFNGVANAEATPTNPLIPLYNQDYALCAGAVSFNLDGITYAKCRIKNGNSLGMTHTYTGNPGGNIETINQIGSFGTAPFMVSTYSPPEPEKFALYSCNKPGAYAQCNGGLCFTNTTGNEFPGLGAVSAGEIMCSCPITTSSRYHVTGPATCPETAKEYDEICAVGSKKTVTGDGFQLSIGSAGPIAVTEAMNVDYDDTFGTTSQSKICNRPRK